MGSVMSNIHLLLGVPSFLRWPLRLHFFAPTAYTAWQASCEAATVPARDGLQVATDFGPKRTASRQAASVQGEALEATWGIHALTLDYAPMKAYVEKTRSITSFEREGNCVVCDEELDHAKGLHVVCSNGNCEGVGHLECWSRHLLQQEGEPEQVMPTQGRCPKCLGAVQWGDMMKELTLRERGAKEVDKLLKTKRQRQAKAKT